MEVYMLADKYFLEELSNECLNYIYNKFDSDNIEDVLNFSANYNYESLNEACIEHLRDSPEMLLVLSQTWLKHFLESFIDLSELIFVESWQHPDKTLQDDTIIQILKSKNCNNPGLSKFAGCVSSKVIRNICWERGKGRDTPELSISFTNIQQANEILSLLEEINYRDWLSIHLQCKMIPPHRLRKIPAFRYSSKGRPDLFLSNVDDNGINWTVSAIRSLKLIK